MTFLSQIADHLFTHHADHLGDCTVVFPNRRSGLFLKKNLSRKIEKPVWSPEVKSLEDFLLRFSPVKKTDTLTLIFELFEAFKRHHLTMDGFESFYFWGEMLLRDFEEVDHYLVDPKQLFHYLESDRQIAKDFYFLDEEQQQIIQKFWQDFSPGTTRSQEKFMEIWKVLAPVYASFKERLLEKNIGYTSHIYRALSDQIKTGGFDHSGPIIFAGFNVLTPVEEKLIKYFIQNDNAEILWDLDAYYLEDESQEAGAFLRLYQKDAILGKTFQKEIPNQIKSSKTIITVTGVSLEIGQAKSVGEEVRKLVDEGIPLEEIVIVLPKDYMLFPVLNAIPDNVDKLNVTMGYPLKETPLFGLLETAIELQESVLQSDDGLNFYSKPTLSLLCHPYLYKKNKELIDDFVQEIKKNNRIRIFHQDILDLQSVVLDTIFCYPKEGKNIANYLRSIVEILGQQVVERFGLEREYLYHFHQLLCRLDEILSGQLIEIDLKTFKRLFQKITNSTKIPFIGDPLEGLQIMGAMETRNLDFRYVFMLNMNEDIFPSTQRNNSFIPYRIRKAFKLPTFEIQETIYAYLFYRLLQRSERLNFYYNMYADFGMSGEVSRLIRQIEQETNLTVIRQKLSNSVQIKECAPISIKKSPDILRKLGMYLENGRTKLSASALNTYLNCRLQFYFKYVLRLFSKDELTDELDARNFGNILHFSLEYLYLDVMKDRPNRIVDQNDFFKLKNSIDGAIKAAFRKFFGMKEKQKFALEGRNLVMASIINKFVNKVLVLDEQYAPFEIVSLEKEDSYERTLLVRPDDKPFTVRLGANIDRVDRKNGIVRVIDYKSGKDAKEIGSIQHVFDRTSKRNKAGFQMLFYVWLYTSKYSGLGDVVLPGLFNMQEIFHPEFKMALTIGGKPLTDARPYLSEFETHLSAVLSEIYDMKYPFDQTEDENHCKYCEFKGICGR